MRYWSLPIIGAVVLTTAAIAQHRATHHAAGVTTAQSSAACTKLNGDMTHLSKSLALNFADGISDNSAPRATMRETQYNTLLTRVRLNMDLMRDNHCKTPSSIPTGEEYVSRALACHLDMLRPETTSLPDSCDQSKWVPTPH